MGGDPRSRRMEEWAKESFNPRPRMGGDVLAADYGGVEKLVSIRAPAWGATLQVDRRRRELGFQSAPPHGGRHGAFAVDLKALKFQSAPPHGGRRSCAVHPDLRDCVSIRAPAWGATGAMGRGRVPYRVSIRAPAWGATASLYLIDKDRQIRRLPRISLAIGGKWQCSVYPQTRNSDKTSFWIVREPPRESLVASGSHILRR